MEATPLEEAHLLRDEMANLVWALEHRIASKAGEPDRRDDVSMDWPRNTLRPRRRVERGRVRRRRRDAR